MKTSTPIRVALALLSGLAFTAGGFSEELPLDRMSISQLEERRDEIKAELETLAVFSLRTGTYGTSGYRSFPQDDPEAKGEWLQIEFKEESSIDEIAIVPNLWRYDDEEGYLSDGFPEAFRILAGKAGESEGTVVAEFDAADQLLPRIAPVVVPLSGVRASWIRIEPTRLSLRERDRSYIFQLSEVLVFSGEENIALRQPVSSAADVPLNSGIWKPDRIVDGGMPYLMDAAQGTEKSAHFQELSDDPYITLDLEKEYRISTIHLHAAYLSKSAPPEFNVNRGIPGVVVIEGANEPDFSDAELLLEHKFQSIGEFAPILMWNIPKTKCRYIRISGSPVPEQGSDSTPYKGSNQLGFAEIEILSEGQNVALEKGSVKSEGPKLPTFYKLTDGFNVYGFVLPIRTWMNQLARRHDLEAELALVRIRLDSLYEKQQATLLLLKRVTIALIALVAATILIGKYRRVRQAARIRERFTADLHDHVGASLHAIGILSSHTKEIHDSPERLAKALDEIEAMTARASEATRDFCNQQMAKEVHENLLADLERTAGRMIANLSYTFEVEGGEFLQRLDPHVRSDFFLFFKECLINVNRHADATEVRIRIEADPRVIHLSVSDNGCGIREGEHDVVPPSLARRARYLGSKPMIETLASGGLRISLKLKTRRWCFPSLRRKEI